MKTAGLREVKDSLSAFVDDAQTQGIVILRHGKPAAVLVGVEGKDLEEAFLLCDEEGVRTRVAVDFFPHVNSTVSLDRFGDTPRGVRGHTLT